MLINDQARVAANNLIAEGHDPEALVHFLHYPHDHELYQKEVLGLSNPLPKNTDLSGHLSYYYSLRELAE